MLKLIKQVKNLESKKILYRVDFNVAIKDNKVIDDFKIIKHRPTLEFLLEKKCKVIIFTHLGDPQPGKISEQFSIKPIAKHLAGIIKKPVKVASDSAGFYAATLSSKMRAGEIIMLENIRFEPGEKKNSKSLAKKLADLADIYVNDAFGVSHRKHASVSAIKQFLPSYAGLLLAAEIKNLKQAFAPVHPLVVVVGGVKLGTKMPLINKFAKIADKILVGGALANNFFAARGYEIGKSIADKKSINLAKKLKKDNIILPVDVIIGAKERTWKTRAKKLSAVAKADYIFDIGPETINLYARLLKKANTILWNGPMGMFEDRHYRHGTLAIGRVVAARSTGKAFGIAGGGETVSALKMTKMIEHVDWVSTGGGAMLTYLSGQEMPGLKGLL